GLPGNAVCAVRPSECAVARLVRRGEPGDLTRAGVRAVVAEEPQERQEAALAEHGEQKARDREVRLVEQGRERGLTARGRQPELAAAQAGAPGEHLDVAGLV